MRLSAEAMNAALADFQGLQYSTQNASAYEAFLTAKWVHAHENGDLPTFRNVGRAAPAVFGVAQDVDLGRLAPFRYDWKGLRDTGRSTIWNQNSRGGPKKKSLGLFVDRDIRNGLVSDAAAQLQALLPAERPSWQSLAVLILRDFDFAAGDDWPRARAELHAQLSLSDTELDAITSDTPLGVALLGEPEWDVATIPEALRPPEAEVVKPSVVAAGTVESILPVSVSVDKRVERMLRLAVTTTPSILLVGPPGTGKGTLLNWLIGQIGATPEAFGFKSGFNPNPLWRTPDESWTSFELIGGLAPDPDDMKLRWTPGALLNALEDQRWLILDETNRGDMDKITGPLLTWLSHQEVEIGRSETHGGKLVSIGWADDERSRVDEDDSSIRYLAGTDFRLFGTYNPQDAQRVFRFGQALSRRFVVIPVPAIRPGQFTKLLEDSSPKLGADAVAAISGLYTAHSSDQETALGPAVFLRMASYLLAGLPATSVDTDESISTEQSDVGDGEPTAETTSDESLVPELLAEAYIMGVGRYLAGLDDRTFEKLSERVIDDENALPQEQWTWVKSQRDVLS